MSIQIGPYHFDGPYRTPGPIANLPGVYAVLDDRPTGDCFVLDVGESAQVRHRLENHKRADCWRRNAQGIIQYAVLNAPDQRMRLRIEQELRNQYAPACGVR